MSGVRDIVGGVKYLLAQVLVRLATVVMVERSVRKHLRSRAGADGHVKGLPEQCKQMCQALQLNNR